MENKQGHISPEQQEQFEQFLLDQMSSKERTAFEEQLKSDKILKAQFIEFREIFGFIEEQSLRNKMEEFHGMVKNEPKGSVSIKPRLYYFQIAAGIAALVAVSAWFLFRQTPNEKLFNKYFTPDPGLPTVMGTSDNYTFYEAMVDYKQGNYDTAIAKWQGLHQLQTSNDTLNYFLGTAFLSNGKAASAIPFLNNTVQNNQSVFYDDAAYYLALAYVKEGKTDQAINVLKSSKDERSKTLLQELTN